LFPASRWRLAKAAAALSNPQCRSDIWSAGARRLQVSFMSSRSVSPPHFGLLLGLAWLLVVFQLMVQFWAATAYTFPDTDDAMRLVQMRDFLAGQGWFDLHQSRVNPPAGFDLHWSRLIDAGLAGLLLLLRQFVAGEFAERLMVALWPVLWLLPVMGGTAAIAWRVAGREAACLVLLLAMFGLPGMGQFRPGRIDHHNVQITLAVLTLAATVWSDRLRFAAPLAGAITGLALAIGFESLPLLALCGAAFAARYLLDATAAPPLRAYGLSLAGSTLIAFLVSVGPDHWATSLCEQLAFNSAAAVIVAGLGIALAGSVAQGLSARCTAVAATAAAAVAVGLWPEPRCIGGPFAIMDPTVRELFLNDISEMQSLGRMLQLEPLSGIATASFPALSVLAVLLVAKEFRRDFGFLTAAAAFMLASATMVVVSKYYNYTLWLGVPLVAVAMHQVFAWLKLRSLLGRFVAALLATPMTVTLGAITLASAAGSTQGLDINPPTRQACVRADNYAALARLPAGLMVMNELEWGPYLLAFTPHSVLAAPYHIRLDAAILTSNAAFALPPALARPVLAGAGVDYVVTCGTHGPVGIPADQIAGSLWGRLKAGEVPDWLERVAEVPEEPFAVYRVR
jgi:hypothetical protein